MSGAREDRHHAADPARSEEMIEIIPTAADVIALKLDAGAMTGDELMQITDLVEDSLAAHEKTHIYAEIEGFTGIDFAALGEYLPRAFAMMGKLKRFGRIAIVSDQAWIRWASKLEGALLPHISYETFTSAEKARALAWVEGRLNPLHDRSARIIETNRPDVFGFELDGRIGTADAEAIADYFNKATSRDRPLRLLARVKKIEGAELGALFGHKPLQMKIGILKSVERYAVVGGPAWLCAWVAAIDPLVPVDLRYFPADEENMAWQWLGALPREEQAKAA
jgi:hypothetical protein